MPSPVIGSTTPAASPTNSTRPLRRAASGRSASGSATPHRLGRLGAPARARRGATGAPSSSGQSCLEVAAAPPVGAQHAVADVRAAARQREHPRVAGQQVALEQHPQPVVVDVGEVLPHRVPLAEIARRVGLERAAHGRPVPVGRDHVSGPGASRWPSAERSLDLVVVAARPSRPRTVLADVDAARPRASDERGVEIAPARDRRVAAAAVAVGGQRERHPAPGRRRRARSRVTGAAIASRGTSTPRPSASRSRSAPVVRPSPQVLSRGNGALSTHTTSSPAPRP